jgi:glycosyltransferase involved in cell wall biosynthesis
VRLLYYSHAFPPQIGGIETFSLQLLEGLLASDNSKDPFEITVLTQTPAPAGWRSPKLPVIVVRRPRLLQMWRYVGRADQVVLAGPAIAPLLFSILRGKRVLVTHHGYQSICPNGLLFHLANLKDCPEYFTQRKFGECIRCGREELSLARTILRLLLTFPRNVLTRLAFRNVCVSEHLDQRLHLPNSVVIRNAISEIPSAQSDTTSLNFSPTASFVYIGRLVVEKGVEVLVKASSLLKKRRRSFQVRIIGDGPERAALEALAKKLDVSEEVQFIGFKKGKELAAILGPPCVLVMPSICQDVAPFAPLEHMIRARPIIASDIGGLSEEVGEAGLKFPPGDTVGLADQMERILLDPVLAERLGNEGRERVLKRYTSEQMIRGYLDLLHG